MCVTCAMLSWLARCDQQAFSRRMSGVPRQYKRMSVLWRTQRVSATLIRQPIVEDVVPQVRLRARHKYLLDECLCNGAPV